MCMRIHRCMQICTFICICIGTDACTYVFICVCICICLYTCACTCMHKHTSICVSICVCIYIYTYAHAVFYTKGCRKMLKRGDGDIWTHPAVEESRHAYTKKSYS